jgi:hypothetical protein
LSSSDRYRRRPRIINKAPDSNAKALAPDAGSISGVVIAAEAMLETPIHRSDRPAIFIIKLFIILVKHPPVWNKVYGKTF